MEWNEVAPLPEIGFQRCAAMRATAAMRNAASPTDGFIIYWVYLLCHRRILSLAQPSEPAVPKKKRLVTAEQKRHQR